MKRIIVLGTILFALAFSVSAQGFYFDIGLGIGKAWTTVNGTDVMDLATDLEEAAVDIGFRAGYGPFGSVPIYVVGELGGMGHRISNDSNYLQLNSYIIGPGVLFYPISLIQLSAGLGYSFVSNQTDLPVTLADSQGGFAWNVAAAVDLGKGNHGCLLGLKFFNAINTLKTTNEEENSAMFSVFVKYTFRHKLSSGI